jgi:hypothetical protein
MTLSTSAGRRITVGELIADAWRLCGIVEISQQPSQAQFGFARRCLDRILDALQSEGVQARSVRLYNLSLQEGESEYSLPDWVADVVGNGAYISETDDLELPQTTSPVAAMSREDWQRLTTLASPGTPARYWLAEDVDPLVIHIWPRPTDDGVIRLQCRRYLADIDNDTQTIDLQPYWSQYLLYSVAAQCAMQTSQKQREFLSLAQVQLERCKEESQEKVNGQFYLDHEVC